MKRLNCPCCGKCLIETKSEFRGWDTTEGVMKQHCWGFCSKCNTEYEWNETYQLTDMNFTKKSENLIFPLDQL